MRLNAIVWDIVGLNAVAGLLWKAAVTAVIAINVVSASAKHHWVGALDSILYREVVSPERIQGELAGALNFLAGVWRFLTRTPMPRHSTLAAWLPESSTPAPVRWLLLSPDHLILAYFVTSLLILAVVLGLQRWMRNRGSPPEVESVCNRLQAGLYEAPLNSNGAGGGGEGAAALALAGGAATLIGVATGFLGLLLLGPLLVAAAQSGDKRAAEAAAQADNQAKGDRERFSGMIEDIRKEFRASQNQFLLTGIAAAIGLVVGDYVAAGVQLFLAGPFQSLFTHTLHAPVAIEAVVVALALIGLAAAALVAPRRLAPAGGGKAYWTSLALGWAALVVAVAAARWLHGLLPPQ